MNQFAETHLESAGGLFLKRFTIAFAAMVFALILVMQLGSWFLANMLANDFSVYWRAANGPLSSVYSPEFRFPFSSLPTMLLWTAPLAVVPMWPAYFVWVCASVGAIVGTCRPYLKREELWFLLASPPMTICLFTGQVSVMLAAIMLWAFGTGNRWAAGIGLGVVATIKPQLVLFAPLILLLRADWRALGGAAAAVIFLTLLSVLLFGIDLWRDWLLSMDGFRTFLYREGVISGVISPAALADKWGLPPFPFLLGGGVVGGWLIYRFRSAGPAETAAAVTVSSLLAAPYGMNYDLVAAAPFLILTIFRGRIASVVAISSTLSWLSLALAGFELIRSVGRQRLLSAQRAAKATEWQK